MTRFELGLITPLRFESAPPEWAQPAIELGTTATVNISFEEREFVWHDPDDEHDPALTALHDDDRRVLRDVQEAAQRLLSALAFEMGVPIASQGAGTSNGELDARQRSSVHPPRSSYGLRLERAPSAVSVASDARVRLALAIYREALSANSPRYRFLAYWNAIEAALPARTERRPFLNSRVPAEWRLRKSDPVPADPFTYFWERSRTPVAHAEMGPSRVSNPDDPLEKARLETDADVLEPLVKIAILRMDPHAICIVYPE